MSELGELKWQWPLNHHSVHAVDLVTLGGEWPDDQSAEALLVGHHMQTGTV